ncbi:MAG: transporter substrate-binding domain-containing protein [Desulfobacteraceae bacterium]|nr:transporter substrate-binding domain-containing protein [Desulfobacteraceae bacterium]
MKKLVIFILLIMSWNSPLFAEDTIYVVNPEWPDFIQSDGTGIIMDILRAVYEKNGYTIDLKIAPYKRANEYVKKGKKDVLFGLYSMKKRKELGMGVKTYTPYYPYTVEKTVAIFKKESVPNWKGQESLRGQRVVAIRGYGYNEAIPVPMEYYEVSEHYQGWRMLKSGRIMFFLDDYVDVMFYIRDNKVDMTPNRIETVLIANLYPAYTMNDRGKKLAAVFDKEMPGLIADGVIAEFYKKRGYDAPILKPED